MDNVFSTFFYQTSIHMDMTFGLVGHFVLNEDVNITFASLSTLTLAHDFTEAA